MTFQNKGFGEMPSARLDPHRNSVQNGVVESFPALTGTIFVNFLTFAIFRTIFRLGKNRGAAAPRTPRSRGALRPPERPLNPFPTRLVGRPPSRANKTKQNKMRLNRPLQLDPTVP